MHKKTFSVIGIFLLILLGAYFTIGQNNIQKPTHIVSRGLWDPEVLNVSYLVKNADTIVIGDVKEILPSKWDKSKLHEDAKIYTDAVIEVERYIKNPQPESELVVRTLGGQVGDDIMIAEDEASFEESERVILFLTKEDPFTPTVEPDHYRAVAWTHGKFSIQNGMAVRQNVPPEYRRIPLEELMQKAQQ